MSGFVVRTVRFYQNILKPLRRASGPAGKVDSTVRCRERLRTFSSNGPVKPGQFPLKVAALAVLPFDADIN